MHGPFILDQRERIVRHGHLFCGIGAGAKGFNMAKARVGNVVARFVCTGGIDVDPGAIRNFERLTGARGTVRDLAAREQYIAFHGHEPPPEWEEATPADIRRALDGPNGERPDIIFLSAPCKGFSGLLSALMSTTAKYQALNALTLRGVWLVCEAYKDGPIPIILFENVPRIMTRGRPLLDQISALLRSYGYNVAETVHDCGELGGLAQSRKRFLLIARQREIIPNFIYEPEKKRLRGVGEVIGKLPLPGDPIAGVMHRVPMLQWKTWLRLALVPAGRDWRALNELAVQDGVLRDYGIVPEGVRENNLGVLRWTDTAPVIRSSQRSPYQGRFSVADVRLGREAYFNVYRVTSFGEPSGPVTSSRDGAIADPRPVDALFRSALGVTAWIGKAATVSSRGFPLNGAYSVADPRPGYGADTHRYVLGVLDWNDVAGVLGASPKPTSGANAIADPRPRQANQSFMQFGVRPWSAPAATIKGDVSVGTGPYAIADLRLPGRARFNNTFRIVKLGEAAKAVAGPGGPAGGACIADDRIDSAKGYETTKYRVTPWGGSSRAVIGASTTGDGAFAIADIRGGPFAAQLHGKYHVEIWIGPASRSVIAGRDNGASVIADPRPVGLASDHRLAHSYNTQAHYGVAGWNETCVSVPGFAKYDRGKWSVGDPRDCILNPAEPIVLPKPDDRLVCRIISTDETWHRPFTTLELAALQSIVDPEAAFYLDAEGSWQCRLPFDLESKSDATKREWIGNAVPPDSAEEIGGVIGEAILLADMGETFTLSPQTIWVSPVRIALAVDTDQAAARWDVQ